MQLRSSNLILLFETAETRKSCSILQFDSFVMMLATSIERRKLLFYCKIDRGNYSMEETI